MKFELGDTVVVLSPYILVEGEQATVKSSFMDDDDEYYVVKFRDDTYELCTQNELIKPWYNVGDIVEYDEVIIGSPFNKVITTTVREVSEKGCYVAGSNYPATDFVPYSRLRKPAEWQDFPESLVIPVEFLASEPVVEAV